MVRSLEPVAFSVCEFCRRKEIGAEGTETEQARELNVPKYSISLVMLRF